MMHAGSSPRNGDQDPYFTIKLASSLPDITVHPAPIRISFLCYVSETADSPRLSFIKHKVLLLQLHVQQNINVHIHTAAKYILHYMPHL
jgi:hypothetical protein